MPYTYIESRFYELLHTQCETLEEAVREVLCSLSGESSWPVKILDAEGKTVWEQSGPFLTSDSIKILAKQQDIDLTEYPDA